MFLLLHLAYADPAVDPALRRACDQQRCGDRCIPWSEACPGSVQRSLAEMQEADRQRELNRVLCGPTPHDTAEVKPEPTAEQKILVGAAVGVLCSAQLERDPDGCGQEAALQVSRRPDVPSPACGERPPAPAATGGTPGTTPTTSPPRR